MRSEIIIIRSPPQVDGVSLEGPGGGEEDNPVLLSFFPAAHHSFFIGQSRRTIQIQFNSIRASE